MNAGAALVEELRHRRALVRRLKQLDARLADGQHGDAHALIFDRLGVRDFEAEGVLPEPERLVEAPRGDSDVFEFHSHEFEARRGEDLRCGTGRKDCPALT
jgi:hypothetical protein